MNMELKKLLLENCIIGVCKISILGLKSGVK
jgi:hypothetical protein